MVALHSAGIRSKAKAPQGCVDYCAFLRDDLLLLTGWIHAVDPTAVDFALFCGPERLDLDTIEVLHGRRTDVSAHVNDHSRDDWGFVLLAGTKGTGASPGQMTLALSDSSGRAQIRCLASAKGSLSAVLTAIGNYTKEQKDAVRASMHARVSAEGTPVAELQPMSFESLGRFVRTHVEWACLVGEKHLFLQGWLLDGEKAITGVYVKIAGGCSHNLLDELGRFQRPDVAAAFPDHALAASSSGFVCRAELFPLPLDAMPGSPSLDEAELLVQTRHGDVAAHHFKVRRPGSTAEQLTGPFLATLAPNDPQAFSMLDRHIGPAIEALWSAPKPLDEHTIIEDFGVLPAMPEWSVIVPLYGRYDFLQYQLAEFSRDPDFQRAELVYVIDDPKILDGARALARDLHPLFRLPFRLAFPGQNLGFAGANNFGVAHSTAPLLLLLNSDVLPGRAGWLSRLREVYHGLDNPGTLGTRLLFEDGTLQHDGVAFQTRTELPGFFLNDHPGKGLPAWLASSGARLEEVPAVTAACVAIARRKFLDLGGLDTGYILGDFEDSHLCLAARKAGMKNYLLRSEVLYHLERLSQSLVGDQGWKFKITLYNAWRHTRTWGEELRQLAVSGEAS